MRTHAQIVSDAEVERLFGLFGPAVPRRTIRAWKVRDSIPSPYWQALVDHGLATFEELGAHAAARMPSAEAA